jgi:hypothetical protein
MRNYSMRHAIRDMEAGKIKLTVDAEAEAEKHGALAKELSLILLPFMQRHSDAPAEVVGTALLQRAAVHLMASYDMSPTDFGALAEAIAVSFQEEARELRKKALSVGQG